MIPSHPTSRRPPGLALVQEQPSQGSANPPPPEGLPQRRASPGGDRPRHALAILQPQAVADAAAQARAQSDAEAAGTDWWNLPPDSNPHGDAAWWATTVADLRAEEQAGPRTQAAPATTPWERPLPESDDESEDGDFPWILCNTGPRAMEGLAGINPARREALARHADDIAHLEDFSLALDLRENNHEALGQSVWDLHDAALHFHADWRATRGTESLAKAQGLDLKHKVLEGLYALKQQHRDWSRLNPRLYEPVIRSLRDALARCRTPASAVVFPIRGFDAPLQDIERQMQETQERLERREWVVRLPGDLDAGQAQAKQIQAWKFHGQAVEDCHGPQDWTAMQEVLAGREVESFAEAQASKVPRELFDALHSSPTPWHRQIATVTMLQPLMEPLTWALARQVHSEIVPAGRHPLDWRALQAAELQRRLAAFAAALAGHMLRRFIHTPPGPPHWAAMRETVLRNEVAAFTHELAHRAHHELVSAEHSPVGRRAMQEALLQSDLRPPADTPDSARERAALHQRLMQACRTLRGLAAELRAALQGPQAGPGSGTADPPPRDLEHAVQAMHLAEVPVSPQAASPPAQPPQAPARAPRTRAAQAPVRVEVPVRDLTQELQALQVAEAAVRQQERLDSWQAALAPFRDEAQRRVADAQACGESGPATEPAWGRHSREFTAWQTAVQAHDACATQAATQAGALFGPAGPEPPAVRSLREAAAQASRDALAQASQAALQTWEAFSQACDAALVQRQGMPEEALAVHCRELHAQWRGSPLRKRMQALEAHMEQYRAFEIACKVTTHGTQTALADAADVVGQAAQLRTAMDITDRASRGAQGAQADRLAAFRGFCAEQRDALLSHAVGLEIGDMAAVHAVLCSDMAPAHQRSYGVSILYDTLLIGDPLPDGDTSAPHSRTGPSGTPRAEIDETAADPALVETVRQAAQSAAGLRARAITLPEDTPPLALSEHQAMRTMLRQGELRGQTAEAVISRFHTLSKALGAARPTQRPGIAQTHSDAMKRQADALRDHVRAMDEALLKPLTQDTFNHLAHSAALLRADLRLAERSLASVQTLQHLLSLRVTANQVRRRNLQGKHDLAAGPAVPWEAHRELVQRLDQTRESMLKRLDDDRGLVGKQPWTAIELTHIEDGLRRLKSRVECEEALIRAKLLLPWAERSRNPKPMHPRLPFFIPALQESVTAHTQALVRVNQEIKEIGKSSGRSQADTAQVKINEGVRRQLLELQVALRDDLARTLKPDSTVQDRPSPAAAPGSSRAAQATPPAAPPPAAVAHAGHAAARLDFGRIQAARAELDPELERAMHRSRAFATDYHVLLTGDPLPDRQTAGPALPAGPQAPQEDRALIHQARLATRRVHRLQQQAIALPPDAPPWAVHEHQVGQLILRQTGLRAQTAAAAMACFYETANELQAARPIRRPAIARRHADTMAQLATDLERALQDLHEVPRPPSDASPVMDLLTTSHLQLRTDLHLVRRMKMSLQVLERLLDLRVTADNVRTRFERGELTELDGPAVQGSLHRAAFDLLEREAAGLRRGLDGTRGVIGSTAWVAEYGDITTSEVQLAGKVECESAMVQARLLLAWAEGALRLAPRDPPAREALTAFKTRVEQQGPALEEASRVVRELKHLSGHGEQHDVQLAINQQVQDKLQALQKTLDRMLSPRTA